MMFGDTIVRVRAPQVTDRYGDQARDWANATRTTFAQVAVQPVSQTEGSQETTRQVVTTGWRVYSRPGVDLDVLATDRFEWADATWDVKGEVARWPHPVQLGSTHHVEFALERAAG